MEMMKAAKVASTVSGASESQWTAVSWINQADDIAVTIAMPPVM